MLRNQRDRHFAISFAAITATSFCFILRALVVDDWGVQYALTETQKGELLGVGLWPFAVTIVLLSLVIDRIGFKTTFRIAGACHLIGLVILLLADGYWMLYLGTLIMALGNGAVEAVANPLVATIYSHDKPKWLNRLHAAWPGGMILGGILAIALGPTVEWEIKVALMLLPILVYLALLFRQPFPVSERVAQGVSYREMLGEAGYISAFIAIALIMMEIGRVLEMEPTALVFCIGALTATYAFYSRSSGRPLFILLVLLMIPLATTELSTDSWISSLMAPEMRDLGLQAGWVLIYTAAIAFVIRIIAGSIIARLTPLGTLAIASLVTAVGLFVLAGSNGLALLAAATLYGIGKSFFWGTSLAVASEQVPKGGAVALNLMAGVGMLAAGVVGSVLIGAAQDYSTSDAIAEHDSLYGTNYADTYISEKHGGLIGSYHALDMTKLAQAPAHDRKVLGNIQAKSKKAALQDIALLPVFTAFIYLCMILFFRARGGYRPVILRTETERSE